MANKTIVLQNASRDLGATGQFFRLNLIDGGGVYTAYIQDIAQPPTQPALASQITATGIPLIAPAGAGDVTGIGTTDTLPRWTDGPNSIIGDSLLTQSGGNIVQTSGNFVLAAAGLITFPDNVRQVFNPGVTVAGLNVGAVAVDPSTPINGDLWYDSALNLLRARVNGASVSLTSPVVPFNLVGVSATAFTVAAAGADYQIQIDTSVASAVTGLKITGNAAGSGITLSVISSGAVENLILETKGVGSQISIASQTIRFVVTNPTLNLDGATLNRNSGSGLVTLATSNAAFPIQFSLGGDVAGIVAGGYSIPSTVSYLFSSTAGSAGAADTNLSRISAGLIGLGTGAAASFAGSLKLTDLIIGTAGGGIDVKEGANATMGTGTLNGTSEVTITTNKVTATSRIFLSIQAPGGTPLGVIYVSSRSAGVSFGVKGAATDTSDFAWWIIEPAA